MVNGGKQWGMTYHREWQKIENDREWDMRNNSEVTYNEMGMTYKGNNRQWEFTDNGEHQINYDNGKW